MENQSIGIQTGVIRIYYSLHVCIWSCTTRAPVLEVTYNRNDWNFLSFRFCIGWLFVDLRGIERLIYLSAALLLIQPSWGS